MPKPAERQPQTTSPTSPLALGLTAATLGAMVRPIQHAEIYLDHNATTPLVEPARRALLDALDRDFGNPSSIHHAGQRARRALDHARERVAALIGANTEEIVFTSGATEANLLAFRGIAAASPGDEIHVQRAVRTAVEHPSVCKAADQLAGDGWTIDVAPVDGCGRLDLEALEPLLDPPGCRLLSAMAVNNELGVVFPSARLSAMARPRGLTHHCDATQAVGRISVDVNDWDVDLLSLSGHKFGAPPGVGALFVRQGTPLSAVIAGHQEAGLRGGSENLPGIIAMAAAADHAGDRIAAAGQIRSLRDRLWTGIEDAVTGVVRNGSVAAEDETGHTLNVSIADVAGDTLVIALDLEGVAASHGAACASGSIDSVETHDAEGRL